MNYSSKLIEDAVNAFASLPSIGRKTALRLVLHLIKEQPEQVEKFGAAILRMRREIRFCTECANVSDAPICSICSSPRRDHSIICVVESIKDVMAIENTQQYIGLYHVLGGVIAPIEGIGPDLLNISSLLERAKKSDVKEIIMAVSPTIEGETTIFYLAKQLEKLDVKVSTLARGISFGGELEYADEVTLGRSIASRRLYEE
jgi:recombination protein RecR